MADSTIGLQNCSDPFTTLENALWFALDSHPWLQANVLVGNKVKFSGDDSPPEKENLAANDLPELALLPSGHSDNRHNTSSSGGKTQRYTLAVSTGDLRTAGGIGRRTGLNQIKWACGRALARYRGGVPDLPPCFRVHITDCVERIDAGDADRSLPAGWSGVLTIECEMQFPWAEVDT